MVGAVTLAVAVAACCCLFIAPPFYGSSGTAPEVPIMYRSTDFEVHRHWLALTAQLPMHEWYRATLSTWTLDYPPLFAYFQAFMSRGVFGGLQLCAAWDNRTTAARFGNAGAVLSPKAVVQPLCAALVDPAMVSTSAHDVASPPTVAFQRATVVLFSVFPFALAAALYCRAVRADRIMTLVVVLSPPLLLIDNVHFQYNGTLFALVFASLLCAVHRAPIAAAGCFFVLVFAKHLFVYYALGYGLWGLAYIFRRPVVAQAAAAPNAGGSKRTGGAPPPTRLGLVRSVFRSAYLATAFGSVLAYVAFVAVGPLVVAELEHEASVPVQQRICRGGAAAAATPANPCRWEPLSPTLSKLDEVPRRWLAVAIGAQVADTPSPMRALRNTLLPLKERLFPFGRGLCHAYWAPNLYPLYNVADRLLCRALAMPSIGPSIRSVIHELPARCGPTSVNTRGLVTLVDAKQGADLAALPTHAALPALQPALTLGIVVLVFAVFASRGRGAGGMHAQLVRFIFASSAAFFLASWHVHEKAMITVTLPLIAYVAATPGGPARLAHDVRTASLLTSIAVAPLFLHTRECVIKYAAFAAHDVLFAAANARASGGAGVSLRRALLPTWDHTAAWAVLVPLSLWVDWDAIRAQASPDAASFAPLMALSVFTSVCVLRVWWRISSVL